MKKLLLLGALISSVAMANTVEFRVGADLSNNGKFKGGAYRNSAINYELEKGVLRKGFELSAEYRTPITESFEVGGGISYKYNNLKDKVPSFINATVSQENKGLHAVPIYFTTRYNFKNSSAVTPYVKANLGYSFNSGRTSLKAKDITTGDTFIAEAKFKGGMYYGVGVGLEYNNFVADLSYNVNSARVNRTNEYHSVRFNEVSSERFRLNHGVLTLGVGYSFDF